MIDISVIIPFYNHPAMINKCVNSILNQQVEKNFEIIIVDSSSLRNQSIIENLNITDSRINLIKLNRQTFPGSARNIGIKESKGKIIALMDADCIASENWLKKIDANMEEDSIITGIIKNGTEASILGTCSYLVEFSNFLEFNVPKREVEVAATCNFAAKKNVFEKFGGFSNDRAFEDFLFCHEFKKMDGKIYQVKDISVIHVNKTNLSEIVSNQRMLGRFSAKVRRKNNMPPKIIFKCPILALTLTGYRFINIFYRVIKTRYIFKFLLFTPIILYILINWSIGFYNGAREGKVSYV